MTSLPLVRNEYMNVSTNTVRTGATSHGESLVDMESYLMRHSQVGASALHAWGVAEGLTVVGTDSTSLTVKPGVAVDAVGHLIALAANGFAITAVDVDPSQVANVPIVPVTADGVVVSTGGLSGDRFLTLTWREVIDPNSPTAAPTLVHAPWLRLQPTGEVPDTGDQVVLAHVVLNGQGQVTALTADRRRVTGIQAGRLELRAARTQGGPPATVDQAATAELKATDGGGLALNLLPASGATQPVLAADPSGTLALSPSGGNVGIGLHGAAPKRVVHVEGNEIHSGGSAGGFSFASRTTGSFVESPTAGERWTWYAANGTARLWSGSDQFTFTRGQLGIGATPTNPLHVAGNTGIRQNSMYLSGTSGWSSLSYNAYHTDDNTSWNFPDPSKTAVTVEMDDGRGGDPRFQVWTTTNENKTAWNMRLGINGENGVVTVPGELSAGSVSSNSFYGPISVVFNNTNAIGVQTTNNGNTALCAMNNTNTGVTARITGGATGLLVTGNPDAASFTGNVHIAGTLSANAKQFVIDHPLDPENRYLNHVGIESDERAVVYSGNVECDESGRATVFLPEWLEALAGDFRYQLTCVGGRSDVYVSDELRDNAFGIAGGAAGQRVSWQLTGIRQDHWAVSHEFVVEEDKPEQERGFYKNPEAFGKDMSASILWARTEDLRKQHPLATQNFLRQHREHEAERLRKQEARKAATV